MRPACDAGRKHDIPALSSQTISLTADSLLRSGLPVSIASRKGHLRNQYIPLTGICQYRLTQSGRGGCRAAVSSSLAVKSALALEGLAVRALVDRGIGLVGADGNAVERAVFCAVTMVGALADRAADRLITLSMVHEK